MAEVGSLVDLLLFYSLERSLFNRMVLSMGKNPHYVKKTIALWLMMEEIGYHDLIRKIHSHDDRTIEAIFNEALLCLECLRPYFATEPTVLYDFYVFNSLLHERINYRLFYNNREFMYKRLVHIMGTVCDKIFGERTAIEVDMSGMRPVPVIIRPIEEVSAPNYRLGLGATCSEATTQANLNPEASEFYPRQIPEDARTLFLTFSKGYPLSLHEIIDFFTSKYGKVVEYVIMEHTRQGQDPQFGRIVFTTSIVIGRILNGQSKAKFLVNRKHLWARPYVQRRGGRSC